MNKKFVKFWIKKKTKTKRNQQNDLSCSYQIGWVDKNELN